MHERSPKNSAIDTLLYESDMLRHCASTIDSRRARYQQEMSESARAEYYLCIEGFLLHFRNLLGFFINKGHQKTDLIISRPERWAIGIYTDADEDLCVKLTRRAEEVNRRHGLNQSNCYQKISWFLQHCTTHRHQMPRSWDIDAMHRDLQPILDQFFSTFAHAERRAVPESLSGEADSTLQ